MSTGRRSLMEEESRAANRVRAAPELRRSRRAASRLPLWGNVGRGSTGCPVTTRAGGASHGLLTSQKPVRGCVYFGSVSCKAKHKDEIVFFVSAKNSSALLSKVKKLKKAYVETNAKIEEDAESRCTIWPPERAQSKNASHLMESLDSLCPGPNMRNTDPRRLGVPVRHRAAPSCTLCRAPRAVRNAHQAGRDIPSLKRGSPVPLRAHARP
ncbi:hypothetical protein NDU88_005872 [Pleurodeles waltl]|uniref:Uncharacterized protein n=1 Tax=Pleurodeles waltl TaxID=8319 RepID=A0AAV7VKC3_PLEWA|nr:hypothetical protein NDU88_005872 [Pleurodeles waltl]